VPQQTAISPQLLTADTAANTVVPASEPQQDMYKEALQGLLIQRKLSIGAVDDPLEHEADAMADSVMRMPETSLIQRKCALCEEEEKVQMKPLASSITPFIQTKGADGGTASNAITQKINATRGSGSSMDSPTQSFMESRFGTDFSGVKIHTGDDAVQMSRELNAQAFTVGSDIYFNSGKYNPSSDSGKHLLAHELTHTVQQGGVSNTVRRQVAPPPPQPQRTAAQQIATTLRNAAAGWGTDEDAIYNALTGRTPAELADIEAAYLALSGGETLEAMLRDEMSGDELSRALSLLRGETPSTEIARTLWNAMRGFGTDESAIYATVAGRTAAQWTDIQAAYRLMTGSNLLTEIRDELNDDEWAHLQTLLPGAAGGAVTDEDRATVIANQLEAAMQGLGTDESAIYAALTGHTEAGLREIERRYRLITGRELNTDLRDELTGGEYEQVQQLLHPLSNPERLARRLHDAVDGLGTREAEIVAILQGRSAAEITQVSAAYQRLYSEPLNARLADELGGADWLETHILLSGRMPNVLEEILISTMDLGTDEERLLAALASLNRDAALTRQLKLDFRTRMGHTLRDELISELSGSDLSRALNLIRDGEDTADEMTSMLGTRMQWRASGPGSGTTFEIWASGPSETPAPALNAATIINCWEVVLLAGYNTGAISWRYIHNLYTNVASSDWETSMSGGTRTTYHVGGANPVMPQRGDIVFFDHLAHVALATGNGSQLLTFWPAPMPFPWVRTINGTVEDVVKLSTIEELNQAWLDNPVELGPPPLIQFARPLWQ
jgi:Domain of unknown function (DUF4157)/Annexin